MTIDSIRAVAAETLAALDERRQVAPFSGRIAGFDLAMGYRATAEIHRLRRARGERPVGRKIGFTNRNIWAEYGVFAPIWGYMYDTTVTDASAGGGTLDLTALLEPRIEPEIAFGLARAPEPGMDEAALMSCIDWVAHGFEIVQSIFPGWRFQGADTVAAFGLHGAYLLGPRRALRRDDRSALESFELTLFRASVAIDRGVGANALGHPLTALRHLVALLADDPANPPLAAGEMVTTGTLTRAFPVAAGESWNTEIRGLALDGLSVRFA